MKPSARLGLFVGASALAIGLVTLQSSAGPRKFRSRVDGMAFEVGLDGPAKPQRHADGRLRFEQKVALKIDGETAEKSVTIKASHSDAAGGGHLHLAITEDASNKTSQFAYTPANNTIALGGETDSIAITKNPDGSYTVAGKKVPDGKAVVALLRANAAYQSIPKENMLVAYASAQTPLPEVKGGPPCLQGGAQGATGPAVCTVFKDVCDCIACDLVGKGTACSRCK